MVGYLSLVSHSACPWWVVYELPASYIACLLVQSSTQPYGTCDPQYGCDIFLIKHRWLDRTPVSRIITRCSQDIQDSMFHSIFVRAEKWIWHILVVDGQIPTLFIQFIDITFIIITKFAAVVLLSPAFIVPGTVLVIAGVSLGRVYMKAQLPVKRESSNARAPVLGHFGAAVGGVGE